MPECYSLAELEGHLKKKINYALSTEVAEIVKEVESQMAEEVVYDAYSPKKRARSHNLSNIANMRSEVKDGTLKVTNEAAFSLAWKTDNTGPYLAGLVEYGNGWNGYRYEYIPEDVEPTFLEPRPFIQATREQLSSQGLMLVADALWNQGLRVEY